MGEASNLLLECLTQAAPSGLSGEERACWVMVARKTLSGLPIDLMERGCDVARLTCRFPSEIVPCIYAEIRKEWERRKKIQAEERARSANRHAPKLAAPEHVTADEARQIIAETLRGMTV